MNGIEKAFCIAKRYIFDAFAIQKFIKCSYPAERIYLYKPLLAIEGAFYANFPYTQKEIIGNKKKCKEYVFLIKNATKNATTNPRIIRDYFCKNF